MEYYQLRMKYGQLQCFVLAHHCDKKVRIVWSAGKCYKTELRSWISLNNLWSKTKWCESKFPKASCQLFIIANMSNAKTRVFNRCSFANLESGRGTLEVLLKYTKRWRCNSYQSHYPLFHMYKHSCNFDLSKLLNKFYICVRPYLKGPSCRNGVKPRGSNYRKIPFEWAQNGRCRWKCRWERVVRSCGLRNC